MNKRLLVLLCLVFPIMASADGSMSFTPPASDLSVVFLGNIFGIVDGILHGNGSQIMGAIFSVFNSAVLALGGIVIMYTLLVSTMNTAQEGQMLGQKWSSIWIPVRSVAGLALLIPKASGYCLMQIFVMWVVVQGVGAADKVWDAALGYLNRGGAIIQMQIDPTKALTGTTGGGEIAAGAQTILAGQACMLALQHQLNNQLEIYKKQASARSGPCSQPSDAMKSFCNSSVPDFLSSVNIVSVQDKSPDQLTPYHADMPNFQNSSIYYALNGICGSIQWNNFKSTVSPVQKTISNVTAEELKTASMSRAIAIQQMYEDLMPLAQVMVGNDPDFSDQPLNGTTTTINFSSAAKQAYGLPHTPSGIVCQDSNTPNCILWGGTTDATGALLAGTELQNAIQDYNGIMLPTLTLIKEANTSTSANASRQFIQKASSDGWIMAGSYFFDLINLNKKANKQGDLIDQDTGLGGSELKLDLLTQPFTTGDQKSCLMTAKFAALCTWMNQDNTLITPIVGLINGAGVSGVAHPITPPPELSSTLTVMEGSASSTVYGYTNNSVILKLPTQPGATPPVIPAQLSFKIALVPNPIGPLAPWPCGEVCFLYTTQCYCVGKMLGHLLWDEILVNLMNIMMSIMFPMINTALNLFIVLPLIGMETIFTDCMAIITIPGINPIVALANMGTYYINFVMTLYMQTMAQSVSMMMIPFIGAFLMAIVTMAMPLLMAWLGIMSAIGFSTAYYVPLLPYMMFTFGAIAWLISVIEAMVAGPIVALGVTHPEGHDAFGKGEQAVMILMNVFLRPSMMIIGYIAAIILAYVSVWLLNEGFMQAIKFMSDTTTFGGPAIDTGLMGLPQGSSISGAQSSSLIGAGYGANTWAGLYSFFFSVLIYTTMYIAVVTKAFTLISVLPDKVLRWIGGQAETTGSEAAQMGEEVKKQVDEGGKQTQAGTAASAKKLTGAATDAIKSLSESKGGGSASASGGDEDAGGGAKDA